MVMISLLDPGCGCGFCGDGAISAKRLSEFMVAMYMPWRWGRLLRSSVLN